MNAHTPGTWEARFPISGQPIVFSPDAPNGIVCRPSTREDATLIAAAPELLALAKELDSHSAHAIGFDLDKLPALMDRFRAMAIAAIAKAEGR